MYSVNDLSRNIYCGMEAECNICSPYIVIYCLGKSDYIQTLFGKKICGLMSSVAAERQYAVELLLFIGGFHFSDLVYVVGFDYLHHLIRCTLCAEYRSALSEYAGKILRLHYTAVIMDQTVETVGYADYLNVVLAEHGVTSFCRTSYSSVKSGAVASARQYTYSALCHLYIQPFLKDLLFSAN